MEQRFAQRESPLWRRKTNICVYRRFSQEDHLKQCLVRWPCSGLLPPFPCAYAKRLVAKSEFEQLCLYCFILCAYFTLYDRCRRCLHLQQAICGGVALLWVLAALPWAHMEGLIQRMSKYRPNQENELLWSGRSCSSVACLAVGMHQRESVHLKFSGISAVSLELVDRLFSISSYLFVCTKGKKICWSLFFLIARQINLERINQITKKQKRHAVIFTILSFLTCTSIFQGKKCLQPQLSSI